MKVVILDNIDQYILDLCLLITKSLGVPTQVESNFSKLDEIIKNNFDSKLFILNESKFKKSENKEIFEKITRLVPKAKIMTRAAGDYSELILDFNVKNNLELISNLVQKNENEKHSGKFKSVNIYKLVNIDPHNIGCDLYIKITKNNIDHYVKRLYSTDQFTKEELLKYIKSGLKEFHVADEEFENFINILSLELVKTYEYGDPTKLDFFNINSTAYEVLTQRIKFFGIDEITLKLVDNLYRKIELEIKNQNALK